ncbi:unnamed protein product, partial [marine sediment metagenome]
LVPSGRENMGWIGASVLYSKDQLKKGWISNPNLNESDQQQEDQTSFFKYPGIRLTNILFISLTKSSEFSIS